MRHYKKNAFTIQKKEPKGAEQNTANPLNIQLAFDPTMKAQQSLI